MSPSIKAKMINAINRCSWRVRTNIPNFDRRFISSVSNRILQTGCVKTFQSNLTRIASTTRTPIGCRIVAAVRERKIDAQFGSAPDNFCFR